MMAQMIPKIGAIPVAKPHAAQPAARSIVTRMKRIWNALSDI